MSNRAAAKRRLRDIAVYAVTTTTVDLGADGRDAEVVPVVYGLPPDTATETCLYFGGLHKLDGRTDPTTIGSIYSTDDGFVVKGTIDAFGFDSDEDAEEAAERILNQFVAAFRDHPRLTQIDGLGDDDPGAYAVQSAVLGDWSIQNFAPIGDTCVARVEFDIRCVTNNL